MQVFGNPWLQSRDALALPKLVLSQHEPRILLSSLKLSKPQAFASHANHKRQRVVMGRIMLSGKKEVRVSVPRKIQSVKASRS